MSDLETTIIEGLEDFTEALETIISPPDELKEYSESCEVGNLGKFRPVTIVTPGLHTMEWLQMPPRRRPPCPPPAQSDPR